MSKNVSQIIIGNVYRAAYGNFIGTVRAEEVLDYGHIDCSHVSGSIYNTGMFFKEELFPFLLNELSPYYEPVDILKEML